MSTVSNTELSWVRDATNIDYSQADPYFSKATIECVNDISTSASHQPNIRDKYPPSTSILSTQFPQPTHSDLNHAGDSNAFPSITPEMHKRERLVLFAMCFALFIAGWNDGTLGPLLPRIQAWYGVNYAIVSVIFATACVGCIIGSITNIWLADRFSFGTIIVAASLCQIITFSIQTTAPPFPVFCLLWAFNGAGLAIQGAQTTGLVASIRRNGSEKMGILHAIYGLGAFATPFVSTQFAQMPRWSFHFLVSLGIALINTNILFWTVGGQSLEAVLESIGSPSQQVQRSNGERADSTPTENEDGSTNEPRGRSSISQILRSQVVHVMALFILVYVGIEVTIGGWIVSFLVNVRGGGPSSGYVSSGFFGGLTVGRIALLWVNRKVGERTAVFIYAALAIALELVVWLVPSLIGNAVAVSFVGLLLGPMYPLGMALAGRVLPRKILTGSIGWIAAFGQAGSAVLPLMTGALASRYGLKALQPLLVAMMVLLAVLWFLIPVHRKRRE
ncbi:MFS general substrate transporter [Serendipita vermifera]|nr:MFS general substrate transporter [Serendipita vermifera]